MFKNFKFIYLFFVGILFYGCNLTPDSIVSDDRYPDAVVIEYHSNITGDDKYETSLVTNVNDTVELMENKFQNEGYVFTGWSTLKNSNKKEYSDRDIIIIPQHKIDNNVFKLYAVWKKQKDVYTVTYHPGGGIGEMSPSYVEKGEKLKLPLNEFIKEGHSFEAWNIQGTHIYYDDGDTIDVKSDIMLYAHWKKNNIEPVKVRLSFNGNGGLGSMDDILIDAGKENRLPAVNFTKEGYYFAGWSKIQNSNNIDYENEDLISINVDTILYAVWKHKGSADFVSITFYPNGGNGEPYVKQYDKESLPETIPVNEFKHSNPDMKFIGWGFSESDTMPESYMYDGGYLYQNLLGKNLYAIWTKDAYKLDFDKNAGDDIVIGEMRNLYLKDGQKIALPDASLILKRANYTPKFYTEVKDDPINRKSAGSEYTMGASNQTLFISWKVDDVSLGGAYPEFANQSKFIKGIKMNHYYEEGWAKNPDNPMWSKHIKSGKETGIYTVQQGIWSMCWAATASNMIHWWLDQNEKYINRYHYTGKSNYYVDKEGSHSDVFHFFTEKWVNTGQGGSIGFKWYISGLSNDSPMVQPNSGAFFKDVFGDSTVTVSYPSNRRFVTEAVTKALTQNMGLSYSYGNHEMAVWGASYDKDGYVDGIYATNSNYGTNMLYYDKLFYDENNRKAYVVLKYREGFRRFYLHDISVYDLGERFWKNYFNE